jgi:hypothetical protein
LNQAQPGPARSLARPYQPIADIASIGYLGFFAALTMPTATQKT